MKRFFSAIAYALLVGIGLLSALNAGAEEAPIPTTSESHSIIFGHNLTPTTYTLKQGDATVGNVVLGVGVTDKVTIATSPWLYTSYNMYSAIARVRGCLESESETQCKTDWGAQIMYLQTGHFGSNSYQMTAANGSFVLKQDLASFYSLNLAINYMYFFDETAPFSLRREPYNSDAYQWSFTALQELRLPGNFGLLLETGILGLNYTYPEIHYGVSMHYQAKYLLAQLGFSQTFTPGTLSHMFVIDQSETIVRGQPGLDFSMHPEVQLQFFF